MADYSLLGSFNTGGASALNGELLEKLKSAEKGSVLSTIDQQLEDITGLDAETGKVLDTLGESSTLSVIKAQALDLMSKMSIFDADTTGTTAFDAVSASTTGTAAVFDAVDIGGLEPGTTNIDVSQLSQRDVYQSITFNEASKDAQMGAIDDSTAALVASAGISIKIGTETFDFSIVQDPTQALIADMGAKTIVELAAEINDNENFIASVETVGTDEYRLVIKSSDAGQDNELTITQTNFNLGFGNSQSSTNTVADITNDLVGAGELNINGNVITTTATTTYADLQVSIDAIPGITATVSDGTTFDISVDDGSSLNITQTTIDLGYTTNQVQKAQNLKANIDGIDYDVASNTVTIQGNLTMTAVEIGKATIDIQKDTSAILNGLQTMIGSYNALVDLVETETGKADGVMNDNASLRSLVSSIKDSLFGSYGKDNDLNLFNFGLELDLSGHLSLDANKFGEALVGNYDDVKSLFLGNTVDEDLASTDATKYLGMGTVIQDYLDELDSSDGMMTRYEASIANRKEKLETEREKAIASLDSKYASMASQFSLYGSAITQMESAFSGLESMIKQSYVSK